MKRELWDCILALLFICIFVTGCANQISNDVDNDGIEGKSEGYITVSIGDDTYTWLEYTGYIPQTNTLVLAYHNGGRPYNHFIPIVDGIAKIANPTGGYIEFSEIEIQPNGDMKAYIKTVDSKR